MEKFEVVEITMRRFYTSEESEIAAQTRFDVTPTDKPRDWNQLCEHMIERLGHQLDGAPLTNVREMTLPEVEEYRARTETDDQD